MKARYQVGQRLAYIARNKCVLNGNVISGLWRHHVGYVKQIRRSLLGVRYVINKAKSEEVHIVPERDILGIVEKRENSNKSNIGTNE